MASKNKNKSKRGKEQAGGRGKQAARIGAGALALGGIAWLTGGLSWQNALEWIKTLAIAGGLALVIRWSIGEPYKIPSGSMQPTLNGDPRFLRGDRVFVNKWIYGLRVPFMNKRIWHGAKPERWDVVVFKAVEENAQHGTLVKRVVGLPGERIHIQDGKVFVNGEALEPPSSEWDRVYVAPGDTVGVVDDAVYFNGKRIRLPKRMRESYAETFGRGHRIPPGMKYGIIDSETYSVVPENHYLLLGDNSPQSRDGRVWGWVPNEHIVGRVACIAWPFTRAHDFTGFSKTWWWRVLVAFVGVLTIWRLFLGRSWRLHHPAGEPGLHKGDYYYVNRAKYGVPVPFTAMRFTAGRNPGRGDLVLYHGPRDDEGRMPLLIGRVAALPGERVSLEEGLVQIDGVRLEEPGFSEPFPPSAEAGPYGHSRSVEHSQVPEGHYFVLSRDGEHMLDGRSLGWTPREALIGPLSFVWWPFSRWGRVGP